jgi:hypothetical protein
MTLIITWKFFERNFVFGIFGVWIFGLLEQQCGYGGLQQP